VPGDSNAGAGEEFQTCRDRAKQKHDWDGSGTGGNMKSTIILGGQGGDIYYELGLVNGLVNNGLSLDLIGNNRMAESPIVRLPGVTFYNLRGDQKSSAPLPMKVFRILNFYIKLMTYALKTDSGIFHIQWLNKFAFFDRIILNLYYKLLGKKLVFTAHNVDARERDGKNSFYNRITLKGMYHLCDHIIVHTEEMKKQVEQWFGIDPDKVSVVKYGINDVVKKTGITGEEARKRLGLDPGEKCLLFFGFIAPYKGLDILISAMPYVMERIRNVRLIVAGNIKNKAANPYWTKIERIIKENNLEPILKKRIQFIDEEEIETYFEAADALVLPYRYIFQSGILFLAMNFGLPVLASDVGSLREIVVEGQTGYMCEPHDPQKLAECILKYFDSKLFEELPESRRQIYEYASDEYSWDKIGERTLSIYSQLEGR